MSLSTLGDDYLNLSFDDIGRRRRINPFPSLIHSLRQINQKLDQAYGGLPAFVNLDEDEYEYDNHDVGKKRKFRLGGVSKYEPKSKALITTNDNKFKISLDTSNYQPDEISVKIVNDKVTISAKHEAKGKDVYEFYEMYRSFDIPENVDPNAVTSHLSATGQLTVEAPMKAVKDAVNERTIPVEIESKETQSIEGSKTPLKDQNSEQ